MQIIIIAPGRVVKFIRLENSHFNFDFYYIFSIFYAHFPPFSH